MGPEFLCGHEILLKTLWGCFLYEEMIPTFMRFIQHTKVRRNRMREWSSKWPTLFSSLLFHPHFLLTSPLCLSARHTDPSRRRSHVPCTLDLVLLCHVASLPGMPTCLCLGAPSLNHGPKPPPGKAFPDVLGKRHSPLCFCGTIWLLFHGRCQRRNTVPLSVSPWPLSLLSQTSKLQNAANHHLLYFSKWHTAWRNISYLTWLINVTK